MYLHACVCFHVCVCICCVLVYCSLTDNITDKLKHCHFDIFMLDLINIL